MRHQLLLYHLEDEFKLALANFLPFDPSLDILGCFVKFAKAYLDGFEAVVLADVLARHDCLTLRALDSDHLTRLLVLQYVASRALDFAVGGGLARDSLHLLTVPIIVLKSLTLPESAITKETLKLEIPFFDSLFLRRYQFVLSSSLDSSELLHLCCGEPILVNVILLALLSVETLEGLLSTAHIDTCNGQVVRLAVLRELCEPL